MAPVYVAQLRLNHKPQYCLNTAVYAAVFEGATALHIWMLFYPLCPVPHSGAIVVSLLLFLVGFLLLHVIY